MQRPLWIFILVASAVSAGQSPFTAPNQEPEFQEVQSSSLYDMCPCGTACALPSICCFLGNWELAKNCRSSFRSAFSAGPR